jgi:hypothetical protein
LVLPKKSEEKLDEIKNAGKNYEMLHERFKPEF